MDYLYKKFIKIRGPKKIILEPKADASVAELTVQAVSGVEITIFCKEYKYKVSYANRFIPDHTSTCYEVFARCTNDAPERLIAETNESVILPPMANNFVSWDVKRKHLVDAYIKVLAARMVKDNQSEYAHTVATELGLISQ